MTEVTRASTNTRLSWAKLHGDVALYKTTGDVEAAQFDTFREPAPEAAPDSTLISQMQDSISGVSDPLTDKVETVPAEPLAAPPPMPPVALKPRKGIYREDGSFLDLTDELAAIMEATQLDAFQIIGFVRREQVPKARVVASYYLAPKDKAAAWILQALFTGTFRVGRYAVVKWTKKSRQAIGIVCPDPKTDTLLVLELQFSANVRTPNPRCRSFRSIQLSEEERALAEDLVQAMASHPGLLEDLEDDAIAQMRNLRAAAEEGLLDAWEAPAVPDTAAPVDLMQALRESVRG